MNAAFLNLYWSLLIIAFGLCVGSFLNVVIYRWPRDLSVRRPLWSFCPSCRSTLHWRDNLPVLSYVLLRGRCRYCRAPISMQYPLVEIATAFTFLLIYDAFFVAKLRVGITDLSVDWPMLLAHWALAAGLVVITVMDLEAYIVDIRVTWIITGLGLLLHTIWAPAVRLPEDSWIQAGPYQATIAVGAAAGLIIGALIWLRGRGHEELPPLEEPPAISPAEQAGPQSLPLEASPESSLAQPEGVCEPAPAAQPAAPLPRKTYGWLVALFGVLLLAAYIGAMVWQDYAAWDRLMNPERDSNGRLIFPSPPRFDPAVIRAAAGLVFLFVAMTLFASHPHPEEDEEIVEAIDSEAVGARRQALWELLFLSPAIILMIAGGLLLAGNPAIVDRVHDALAWTPVGEWRPLLGLATALGGWVIGGALAWATRVFGTLGLGKEAFGMGDVHIMAAIGAVAGWAVAFIGFFGASLLALLGMMVILFRRQGRALPYGPWLALASFIVVIFQDKILSYLQVH